MSEKPVIDLLIKVRTNFRSAISSIKGLDSSISSLISKIDDLQGKRVTIELDTSHIARGIQGVTDDLKRMKELITKAGSGKLTKKEVKEFENLNEQIRMASRFNEAYTDNVILRNKELEKNYKIQQGSSKILVANDETHKRTIAHLRDMVKAGVTHQQQLNQMPLDLNKIKEIEKYSGFIVGHTEATKNLLLQSKKPYAELKKSELAPADKAKAAERAMAGLSINASKTIDLITSSIPTMKAWSESVGGDPNALKKHMEQLVKMTAVMDLATKAQATFKTLSEDKTAGIKGGEKLTGVYQSTNRVLDDIISFRGEKFPFFQAFNLPEQMLTDLGDITDKMENNEDVMGKWKGTFKNTMGTALTYTGQFDKRMRYLSRDLYIFGIYFSQIGQMAKQRFGNMIKMSGDLEGAFEDLALANSDMWEPIADTIAPIIEDAAELVESFADLTENMPGKGAIGILLLLGTVMLSLFGTVMRTVSMYNLWKNSAAVMIKQQRELTAAQADHERHIVNLGIQYQTTAEKLVYLSSAGKDASEVAKLMDHDFKVLDGELNRLRQEMVQFGGDTSKFMQLFEGGINMALTKIKHMDFDPRDLLSKQGMEDFRKTLYLGMGLDERGNVVHAQSSMSNFMAENLKGQADTLAKTMGGIANIMRGKEVSPKEDIMAEFQARIEALKKGQAGYAESVKKTTARTRSGTSSMFSMIVMGGLLTGVIGLLAGVTESAGSLFETLLAPFEPLISDIEDFFDWLEGKLSDMTSWEVAGIALGLLLGGSIITGLVTKLGASLVAKITGYFTGAAIKTAITGAGTQAAGWYAGSWLQGWMAQSALMTTSLFGIPVIGWILAIIAAIALIAVAWKNNWGDIQGKTKKFFEWLGNIIKGMGEWIDKYLINPLKEFLGISSVTRGDGGAVSRFGKTDFEVPALHTGGIVQRNGLFNLQKGETVTPARHSRDLSRSSVTNHIYVTVHIDKSQSGSVNDKAIGKIVSDQIARQLGRRI